MALAILWPRSACDSAPSVRRDGHLLKRKVPRRRSRTLRSLLAGIGQGRVTDNLAQDIDLLDGALHIPDADTIRMIYHLLDRDGLYVGASTALNVVAAKKLAEKLGKGSRVVTILCDGAYRYVSVACLHSRGHFSEAEIACECSSLRSCALRRAVQVPIATVLQEVARVKRAAQGDPRTPPKVCRASLDEHHRTKSPAISCKYICLALSFDTSQSVCICAAKSRKRLQRARREAGDPRTGFLRSKGCPTNAS